MALDLIRARCPPLEGTMEEDDDNVKLTLALSVGGSSRKAPRAGVAAQGRAAEAKSGEVELDLGGSVSSPSSFPGPPPLFVHVDGEGAAALDQARRREIHALRRREARRKRDEKKQQQRRGICRAARVAAATRICGVVAPLERTCSPDDRLAMEAREQQVRTKDREARVEETLDSVPNHKPSASHSPNPNFDVDPNPSLNPDYSNPNLVPFTAQSFPMVTMPFFYPHLQYVTTTNGFGIPCMMPYWAPAMSPPAERPRAEGNVFQPVACHAFQPYSPPVVEPSNRESPVSSNAVESNAGKGAGVERAASWTASQGSSSPPAASGHHSGYLSGSRSSSSSTSDGRSHSRRASRKPQPPPPLQQATSLPQGQSDNSISSRSIEPDPPPKLRRQTPCPNGSPSANKPAPAAGDWAPPRRAAPLPHLPRMPCVSTTGNGPNGRTIRGVLYSYTKTEVSIVCACHGCSFSPAEFVRHAGGTDVTHPLRQITVFSS